MAGTVSPLPLPGTNPPLANARTLPPPDKPVPLALLLNTAVSNDLRAVVTSNNAEVFSPSATCNLLLVSAVSFSFAAAATALVSPPAPPSDFLPNPPIKPLPNCIRALPPLIAPNIARYGNMGLKAPTTPIRVLVRVSPILITF